MPSKNQNGEIIWGCKNSYIYKIVDDGETDYYTSEKYLKNKRIWDYKKNIVMNTLQFGYWEYAGVKIMFSRRHVISKDGGNTISIDNGKFSLCGGKPINI